MRNLNNCIEFINERNMLMKTQLTKLVKSNDLFIFCHYLIIKIGSAENNISKKFMIYYNFSGGISVYLIIYLMCFFCLNM